MVRHIVVTMNADFAGGVGHGEYSLESGWCGRIPPPSGAVCGVRLVRADRSGSIARPRSQVVLSDVPQQGMAGETRARPRARPCRPAARPVSCAEGRTRNVDEWCEVLEILSMRLAQGRIYTRDPPVLLPAITRLIDVTERRIRER